MEEERRARARDGDTAESPRKGKAPRLEQPASALEADSLRGGAAALEASDPGEDPGDWEVVAIRDTDGEECEHNICNKDEIDVIVSTIAAMGDDLMCGHRMCRTTGRHLMMVCSECDLYFCIEGSSANRAKPLGHIREHAFRKAHWVALRYEDPYVGYCFKCEDPVTIEKRMMVNGEEDCDETEFANGHGCVIKGIPNHGNTCYLNALLQCLLVLGKLRERMFGPDTSLGIVGTVLHDLFVDTNSVSYAQDLLDPRWLLAYVRRFRPRFIGTYMQDSHELLCCLRDKLNEEEMIMRPNIQQSAPSVVPPTVIDSIFGGLLSVTTSCKCRLSKSVSQDVFYDLSVPLPPKGTPAKSVSSPPQNERCISQQKTHMELFPAIDKTNTEKIRAISEGGDPQFPASESEDMVMVKTSEPLGVDPNHFKQIWKSKDDVHGPLQTPIRKENARIASGHDIERTNGVVLDNAFNGLEDSIEAKMDTFSAEVITEDKGKARNRDVVYDEAEDINSLASIEECLELHFKEEMIEWRCESCSKVAQKASTISGKDGELMMTGTNVNGTVDGDQTEQSDRKTCQSEQSSDLIRLAVECSSSSRQPNHSGAQHQVMPPVDMKTKGNISGMSCDENDSSSFSIVNREPECLEGVQEDVPGCCLAEKLANLLNGQCQNASIQDQGMGKQVNLGHSAHQVEDNQYDRPDRNEGAIRTCLICKLPPVLTIHLKRSLGPLKVSGHVSFKEILDVGLFMHPSSEDKDNSSYRLVGVVEHQGLGSDIGHFVAYVRASHQQHNSGSSTWFCASDANINEISLDEVLKCEAYLLFYERMEG